MVGIRFVSANGDEQGLEIDEGVSLMEGAVRGGIDGIDADCGGQLACATCHVYIDASWADRLKPPSEDEIEMLEHAADVDPRSRLSCQISITAEMGGLIVHVPVHQR